VEFWEHLLTHIFMNFQHFNCLGNALSDFIAYASYQMLCQMFGCAVATLSRFQIFIRILKLLEHDFQGLEKIK